MRTACEPKFLLTMKSIEPIAGPTHGYLTALRLFRGKRGNRGSRLHVLPIQEGVGIIGRAFSPARDRLPFLLPISAMNMAQDLPHGPKLSHGGDVLL